MDVLDGFDPVLEHRVRLAVGVLLAGHGEISFARLKQQLSLTDGNLGAQLRRLRSEEHTSELQSLMRISYAVFCLKKKITSNNNLYTHITRHTLTINQSTNCRQ